MKVTGSTWNAEDWLQETLLKSFSSLSRIEQALNPRVIYTTKMDSIRKNKLETEELEPENTYAEKSVSYSDIYDAIETMVQLLPPKQTSVLLLIDTYNFTAKKELKHIPLSGEKKQVIKKYMDSFVVNGDFQTIGTLLAEYATNEVVGKGLDIGKDQILKNSMGDWASGGTKQNLSSSFVELWGKGAIVFTKEMESGPVLWDTTTVEINDNYIYDDPDLVLIKVTADTAEYWDSGNKFKMAKFLFRRLLGKNTEGTYG